MKREEVEQIVKEYQAALKRVQEDLAKPVSLLPCSKARVRYAFLTYLDERSRVKKIEKEEANILMQQYIALDSFIKDEDAEMINDASKKTTEGKLSKAEQTKYNKFLLLAYGNEYAIKEVQELLDQNKKAHA